MKHYSNTYHVTDNRFNEYLRGRWDEYPYNSDPGKAPEKHPDNSFSLYLHPANLSVDLSSKVGRRIAEEYLWALGDYDRLQVEKFLIDSKINYNIDKIFKEALELSAMVVPLEEANNIDLSENIPCLKSYLMGYSFLFLFLSQHIKTYNMDNGSPTNSEDLYTYSDLETLTKILKEPHIWDDKINEFNKDKKV